MASKRMISPSLLENYQFSQLTDREKLIYIGLILIADDEGRFKAEPHYLRSRLFPYDTGEEMARVSDLSRGLNKIMALGMVDLWQVNGEQVGEHPNWQKYQKIRAEIKKPSTIPSKSVTEVDHSIGKVSIGKVSNILQPEVAGIKDVMTVFYKSVNPTINWNNKTIRSACADLIKKFGLEETVKLATYACSVQGKQFCPVITTPYQLKEKLGALKIFSERNKSNSPKVV